MHGVDPLSYLTIMAWAQLTGTHPTPREVSAMITLDAVLRGALKRAEPKRQAPSPTPAWPDRHDG